MELQSTLPQGPKGVRRLGRALPDIGRKKNPLHFCTIGSPCPERTAMVCRPLIHRSHTSRRDTQLSSESQSRVLITVPELYKWTSPPPETLYLTFGRPSLPVQRDSLPYDAAIRRKPSE